MAIITAEYIKDPDAVLDYGLDWGAADWLTATAYDPEDYVRDPDDGLFYKCKTKHTSSGASRSASDSANWTKVKKGLWLKPGDTISGTPTWTVTKFPTGAGEPTLAVDSSSNDDYSTTCTLSGGTAGKSYEVTNHIQTAGAREDDRTLKITIKEK